MYKRDLWICLLVTVFWVIAAAQPGDAISRALWAASTVQVNRPNPDPEHPTAEINKLIDLLCTANFCAWVFDLIFAGLLVLLVMAKFDVKGLKKALEEGPIQKQVETAVSNTLSQHLTQQKVKDAVVEALSEYLSPQKLSEAVSKGLGDRLTVQNIKEDLTNIADDIKEIKIKMKP